MIPLLIEALGGAAVRHGRRTLLIAAAVVILGGGAATRLRLDPSVVSFLPAHHPAVVDFRRTIEALGTTDQHIVVIDVPRGADAAAYEPRQIGIAVFRRSRASMDVCRMRAISRSACCPTQSSCFDPGRSMRLRTN